MIIKGGPCILIYLFFALIHLFPYNCVCAQDISLVETGYNDIRSEEERFFFLYKAHLTAYENNVNVDYSGIDTVYISVPKNAKPIPLTRNNDFKGAVFYVNNQYIDAFHLFSLRNPIYELKNQSDSFNYKDRLKDLDHNKYLLVLTDNRPWVYNRSGFDYGAVRKDILYVNRKRIKGKTIAPYLMSDASLSYFPINNKIKICNIDFIRDSLSTKKSLLLIAENVFDLSIESVNVETPENKDLYGDAIITIRNASKVLLKNITVDGTYSFPEVYGYAFALNNIKDLTVDRVNAYGKWGVFCCNNINTAKVENSTINRFDLHCYGCDFVFNNCVFTKTGLPLSSIFGNVKFKSCVFKEATSIIYRSDYNAYTPFDVKYEDCIFLLSSKKNYMIYLPTIPEVENQREELKEKNLPNIEINNCSFYFDSDITIFYIFKGISTNIIWGNISSVSVRNAYFDVSNKIVFSISDNLLLTKIPVKVKANKIVSKGRNRLELVSNMYYNN